MPSGSCFCGKIKVGFEGPPIASGLCHCDFCKKASSSAYTVNSIVKSEDFKITGDKPSAYTTTGGSGRDITNYFCPTCGSNLYSEGGFPGSVVVRMGTMGDDGLENAKPSVELFSHRRITWIKQVDGAADFEKMEDLKAAMAGSS